MPGMCAVCLEPFASGFDKFVLEGTEAFHPKCAAVGLARSVRRVLERDYNAERLSNEKHKRHIELLESQLESVKRMAKRDSEALASANHEVNRIGAELADAQNQLRLRARRTNTERVRQTTLESQLATATKQIEALQLQVLSLAKDQLPTPEVKDTRSDMEIRASLLELD